MAVLCLLERSTWTCCSVGQGLHWSVLFPTLWRQFDIYVCHTYSTCIACDTRRAVLSTVFRQLFALYQQSFAALDFVSLSCKSSMLLTIIMFGWMCFWNFTGQLYCTLYPGKECDELYNITFLIIAWFQFALFIFTAL